MKRFPTIRITGTNWVSPKTISAICLRATRQPAEARKAYANALERFQTLSRDFPKVPKYRQELANSYNSLGSLDAQQHNDAAASVDWQQAAALLERLVKENADVAVYRGDWGMVLGNLGLADYTQSRWPQARADFGKSIEILKQLLENNPNQVRYQQVLRDDYQNLAEVLLTSHDHAGAAEAARELAKVFGDQDRDHGRDHYLAACFLARCATEANRDEKLDPAQRKDVSQHCSDEAIAMLCAAVQRGFHDAEEFKKDQGQRFRPSPRGPISKRLSPQSVLHSPPNDHCGSFFFMGVASADDKWKWDAARSAFREGACHSPTGNVVLDRVRSPDGTRPAAYRMRPRNNRTGHSR